MFNRRSLRLPITLAILMIVLLVALIVGWVIVTAQQRTVMWVTLLSVGTTSLVLLLLGTVFYLVLSIKAINLTRRQSNFIDSVTHELKSPIASLKLYLQTLSKRQVNEQQRDDFYGYMLDDVDRLDHLINHILHAGRLEKQSKEKSAEVINLSELLVEVSAAVCGRHEVSIDTIRLSVHPCWIACDRLDLELIFRNLLDNAVKYGGDPPNVQVELRSLPGGKARILIRDNGEGIPKNLRRKIFARFVRLGSELQRKKPGTGLGLYIVRTLVDRWKGRVEIRDAEGNSGTTFQVDLAGTQANPPAAAADSGKPNGANESNRAEQTTTTHATTDGR